MIRKILGVDPGFASFGWAVVLPFHGSLMIEDLGIFETKKSAAKRNVRAADDNLERARELVAAFRMHALSACSVICAESMSYPRNASAAAKMAISWGIIATFAELNGIPIVQATPQEVKKAVTQRKDASKEEVARAVDEIYGENVAARLLHAGYSRTKHEHAYDALAAISACAGTPVVQLLLRESQGGGT